MIDPNITYRIARAFIEDYQASLGPELVKTLLGAIRARDFKRLATASELEDQAWQDPARTISLRQVEYFFKKNAHFSDEKTCMAEALSTFLKMEELCAETNKRLEDDVVPDWVQPYLRRAQHYVEKVLGDVTGFLDSIPRNIRITSGATNSLSRREATLPRKLTLRQSAPLLSKPLFDALSMMTGIPIEVEVQDVNRVEFVPKNWKTHRTIACEPTGIVPLQLAGDTYVKSRLKRFGIDLSNQLRNRELAKEGSRTGKYATIDLSSASDTLSKNVVCMFLPFSWWDVLRRFRCKAGRLPDDRLVIYEKFSSMGNGLTFTLETLFFAALCYAVSNDFDFSVYGDDIIIRTELYEDLSKLLTFFGFLVNPSKSFSSGPFRESCGWDCYGGRLVTPFKIEEIKSKPDLCHLINNVVALGPPEGSLWRLSVHLIDEYSLPFCPFGENTVSGIFVTPEWVYRMRLTRRNHFYQVPEYKAYIPLPNRMGRMRSYKGLMLWYFTSLRLPWATERVTSSFRIPDLKPRYRRKWVCWTHPVAGTPAHLYWWSEYVTARETGLKHRV